MITFLHFFVLIEAKKIKTLSEGNQQYTLTYGIDDQRRKSEYKLNGATQKTKYYLGNYEEETDNLGNTKKIHYLSGGAIYILSSHPSGEPEGAVYYTYTDYLGSLIALTNESGTVVERYAYDPWGARRNPTNWTQTDNRTTWIVNRGYTQHEHIDQFGIINMNGRVYDPLTAQFFSPDPFVQAPGNWLNFNRYAYAFGNPFKYTDPDGEFILTTAAIIAISTGVGILTGGYAGYKIAEAKGYNIRDGETWAYMLGGAAIGGLAGWAGSSLSTGLSASIIASGGTAMDAAVVSGALSGMATGGITNGGMTALSGGGIMDVIGATIQGGAIGGFSGAAGSAVFQGTNQIFNKMGILKNLLLPNTTSYMLSSTASQMTTNFLTGNGLFENADYGINLGLILPFMVDVSVLSNSFALKMAAQNNTENFEYRIKNNLFGPLGRSSDLTSTGDLNYNNGVVIGKKWHGAISGEYLPGIRYNYKAGYATMMWTINGPFIQNYRSLIQSIISLYPLRKK